MKKGFYFSFDALMALTLMSATLMVVAQSSMMSSDPFKVSNINYKKASTTGQDAMKIASEQSFETFDSSFQNELVDNTVMEEDDLDRNIVDGISLLWAARNFSYAKDITRKYFDQKVPDRYEYKLAVKEGSSQNLIYESEPMPPSPSIASSISRLVSGHRIDRPSEGFQARARATSVTKNETKSFALSPQGGARFGGKLELWKDFNVSGNKIWNASLYITPHYGCANNQFENVKVNGNNFKNDIKWINKSEKCSTTYDTGTGALGFVDVTDEVTTGENSIYIRFRNNDYNAHLHPGMRMRIKYRSEGVGSSSLKKERIYFEEAKADEHADDKIGLFSMKSYQVPEGASIKNVSFHLEASGVDRKYNNEYYDEYSGRLGECQQTKDGGWYDVGQVTDVRIFHDDQLIHSGYAPSDGEIDQDFNLTDETHKGTNLVSAYLNWEGDCGWGEDQILLKSDFESDNSTYIDVWYEEPAASLEFGKVKVSQSEFFDEGGNPATHSKKFDHSDLFSTRVFPTQLTGSQIGVYAWPEGDSKNQVFTSPATRAVPTNLYIDPQNYDTSRENFVELEDQNSENDFLRRSSFQYTMNIPSQVGYGSLFDTKEEAVEEARDRLENTLGDFVDATGIANDTVSTGDQPYLWGPASVRLVIWRE